MEQHEDSNIISENKQNSSDVKEQHDNLQSRSQDQGITLSNTEALINNGTLNAEQIQPSQGSENPSFPSQLPLQSVRFVSTQLKEALLNSYVIYRVSFIWDDKNMEVSRRLSDFSALRTAICNLLPFSFIFPVHKPLLIVW
jgi:hypothetical protein